MTYQTVGGHSVFEADVLESQNMDNDKDFM